MQSSKPLQRKQKRMKNKECSLYGIFILKKTHGQNPENFQKLRYFAMYLQSPEYIAKNSTFR
mgnify:CR=1 FL=1